MIKAAIYHHPDCDLHDMGDDHPESPERIRSILAQLKSNGTDQHYHFIEAEPVNPNDILRVHHAKYFDQLKQLDPEHGLVLADADTYMGPNTIKAAYLGAGSGVQAVEDIMANKFQRAFCAIRPPGHHAEPGATMGFCFFNNIAVAAEHLRANYNIKRIAILDFDVHQCNGTIEMYKGIEDVLVCSSFQHPLYPNSHWNVEETNIVNTPLVAFSTIEDLFEAWKEKWLPALEAHKPEFIFISAGFDAHTKDLMGQLNWFSKDYYDLTKAIMDVAKRFSKGRVVSMLEGGYQLSALAESVDFHLQAMADQPVKIIPRRNINEVT